MSGFWEAEQARQLGNLVQFGTVRELDTAAARVRVEVGDNLTAWLPWLTLRAGPDRTWWAPEPGEQVVVLAPVGDMAQGVVLPGIYSDAHPAPASSADVSRCEWKDGASAQYDRAAHRYELSVPAGGQIVLRVGQTSLQIEAGQATLKTPALLVDCPDSTFKGNITVQGGDVVADGISLKRHKHTGVQPGGGVTGGPV